MQKNYFLIAPIILCLIFSICNIGYAQQVGILSSEHNKQGIVPIEPLSFQDKTQTGSLAQAVAQFNRFANNHDIFTIQKLLKLDNDGASYWIAFRVNDQTQNTDWSLSFAPQSLAAISPIKKITLYDPMQSTMALNEWSSYLRGPMSLQLKLPKDQDTLRLALIETWPGLSSTVLPLLKTGQTLVKEAKSFDRDMSLFLLLVGIICGAGLIQVILSKQKLHFGLAISSLVIGTGTYILQQPQNFPQLFTTHPIYPPLLFSVALSLGASLIQHYAGQAHRFKQPIVLILIGLNLITLIAFLTSLPYLIRTGIDLSYVPQSLQSVSALILIGITLHGCLRQTALTWFLPAWMAFAIMPWIGVYYPFLSALLYASLLLIACVASVFFYWSDMTRETVSLQRKLKQDLKYSKEKHESESRDWQQKLDSERTLLNDLKSREQQRSAELDLARREAESANKAKSDFLAIISHEIRTPMNGIMGILQLMRQTSLNEKQLEYVDVIKNSGDSMVTLLNDILDYSKIEKGAIEIENIPFMLRNLVSSIVMLMTGRARDKGLDIKTEIDDKIPDHLMGDPNRLRQILLNLISNAIKFTDRGYVMLTISMKNNDHKHPDLLFEVTDTGMGIAEDIQSKLFQPYVQADASISRRFGGTGLGLNICRMLVAAMDGEIGLTSELNKGSTFWFQLHLDLAPDDIAIKTISTEHYQPSRLLSVLVIDDNSVNLKVVSGLLEIDGHSVTTTVNAEVGLKLISEKTFDLVLVDLMMPIMDGKSFTLEVRKNPNQFIARTPVYALTGLGGDIAKQTIQSSGMQGLVTKPVTQQSLRAIIESVAKTLSNQEQDPEMALKDLINKLSALAPEERVKIVDMIKEGTQGVKDIYNALRHEVRLGMASDTLPPQEQMRVLRTEAETTEESDDEEIDERKPKPIPYLNHVMLADLSNSLPKATLDSLFAELILKAKDLTDAIEDAKRLRDNEDLTEKAHNMKGMAGNFGLEAMMQLCGRIENLGRSHHEDKAMELVPKVRPVLEKTLVELEEWLRSKE